MLEVLLVRTVIPAKCHQGLLITFVSSTHANNHTQTLESGSAESNSSPDKWPAGVRRGDSRKEKHSRPHQHDNHHIPLNGRDEDQSLSVLVNKNLNNKECGVIYGFKQPLIFSLSFPPLFPSTLPPFCRCRLPPTKIQRVSAAFISPNLKY